MLYGQRVLGVVRVTDVPSVPGGRAYLVERGLEEEGANANAALQALSQTIFGERSFSTTYQLSAILLSGHRSGRGRAHELSNRPVSLPTARVSTQRTTAPSCSRTSVRALQ